MQTWIEDNIRHHRKAYLFQGFLFVILGAISLFVPMVAAESFELLMGAFLVITGVTQALSGYASNRHKVILLSSMASIIAGALMLIWPDAGVLVLATIVGVFLLAEAIFEIATAVAYAPFTGWIWMLLSGIVTLALATMIFVGWPVSGVWILGILLGINFLFFGMSMLMIVNSVKSS